MFDPSQTSYIKFLKNHPNLHFWHHRLILHNLSLICHKTSAFDAMSRILELRYFAINISTKVRKLFTNHLYTLLCVIINRYKWVTRAASWVMTHETVCKPQSNYNTTHNEVLELMSNNFTRPVKNPQKFSPSKIL